MPIVGAKFKSLSELPSMTIVFRSDAKSIGKLYLLKNDDDWDNEESIKALKEPIESPSSSIGKDLFDPPSKLIMICW